MSSTPDGRSQSASPRAESIPRGAQGLVLASNVLLCLALFGLAWGRFPEFYRDPVHDLALALALVPTIALLGTSMAGKGVKHAEERGYLAVANLLWTVALLAMIFLRGHHLALLPGDGPLRIAGLLVLAAGSLLRSAAMLQLGRRFSLHVALQEDHALRVSGLYAHVRHPSYLGILLILLGLAMVFESQFGIGVTLVAGWMIRGRMEREERFLLEQFGDEYRDYVARSKRLVPGVY
jgi:protein-S-isoprenylcysteine O-methyltransferase Ste14